METFKRRFYDSHPELPLDPDSEQSGVARTVYFDWAHVLVVAVGAFCGTLTRYELSLYVPDSRPGWPLITLLINISASFYSACC